MNLLSAKVSPVERIIVGLALAAMILALWRAFSNSKIDWRYFITGVAILAIAIVPFITPAPAIALAIAFVPSVAVVAVVAAAVVFVPVIAINPAFTSSFISAFAPSIVTAITIAPVISHAIAITPSIALVFALAFVFAFALARQYLTTSLAIGGYWTIFNACNSALAISSMVWFLVFEGSIGDNFLLQIFLVILPLINAFMDWLSLGVTRGFLYAIHRRVHHGRTALAFVVFDIIVALFFLWLIISITIIVLAGANAVALHEGGEMLFDLHGVLDGLEDDPLALEYGWIHFMMLTTLIPTLIHFAVAGASAVMVFPNRWRESILRHWDERGDAQTAALWYVTLVPALGLIAPLLALYGLYALLSAHGGAAGMLLVDWARTLSVMFD